MNRLAWGGIALGTAVAVSAGLAAQQSPTFRAGVDMIAVDVQVVDRTGQPIDNLPAGKFAVSIDGHDRRVVSVDQVRHATETASAPIPSVVTGPMARNESSPTGSVARTFLIAFDVGSFSVADSRLAAEAARAFVDRLQPNDIVGLYSFPFGPRVMPTADRPAVRAALATVTGGAKAMTSQFHLTPAEVIDINAEMAGLGQAPNYGVNTQRGGAVDPTAGAPTETLQRVLLRECGSQTDSPCAQNIEREVSMLGFYYENQVVQEINGLSEMMRAVGTMTPGRKTVVMLSAGMPAADRPGARPNINDLARVLGEEAARADATIYTLFFDSTSFQVYAPETRKVDQHPVFQARESEVLSRFLDNFASTSGGTLMRVVVGAGESALAQILRETSAYYLLGVAPDPSDRDGKTHRLHVKVDAKGATIRSRTYVHIPVRPPA
jgi:VWFA-related protein